MNIITRSIALLLLVPSLLHAQSKGPVATWWPDPATGLMWTGEIRSVNMNFADAESYCSSLQLDGYRQWRLPTIAELDSLFVLQPAPVGSDYHTPALAIRFKTREALPPIPSHYLWSTTTADSGQLLTARNMGMAKFRDLHAVSKPTDFRGHSALCVRAMEPDLLKIAQGAHPQSVVTGLNQLNSLFWTAKSESDRGTGQIQDAVLDAQHALSIEPTSIQAVYDLGLAQGLVGQWDDSIKTLEGIQKKYGNFNDVSVDLKLAMQFQKQTKTDPSAMLEWTLTAKAKELLVEGNDQGCIDAANQIIQLEPSSPLGYQYLGLAQESLGQFDKAIPSLQMAWKLDKVDKGNSKFRITGAQSAQADARNGAATP